MGVFVLTLTSYGVFGLHFNPLKGDTLKTHYYFFLIGISFVFIVVDLLRSSNFWKNYAKIFFLIFTFIFISESISPTIDVNLVFIFSKHTL